jgi:hypothetical protein
MDSFVQGDAQMQPNIDKLKKFNLGMGFLHFIQGTTMLLLVLFIDTLNEFRPTIFGRFFEGGQESYLPGTQELFTLPFGVLAASFLLLSAVFHFLIGTVLYPKYLRGITQGINKYRWYEYALSSSLMIVLLTTLFGLLTIESVVLVFTINALMNFFGLLMEEMNPPGRKTTNWKPYIFGWVAGIVPWGLILLYLFGNTDLSLLPWFVIPGVTFYFLVFNAFGFNQFFQYKKIGPWADYIFGERMYIVLSLVGKSVLAWMLILGIILA